MKAMKSSIRLLCILAAMAMPCLAPTVWADGKSGPTVVIDAGHGGKDPGTCSRAGLLEKDVNLAIARDVAAELRRQGVSVVLTRDRDVFVGLDNRAEIANRCGAGLLVSLHCDFNASASLTGFSVLTSRFAAGKALSAGRGIAEDLQAGGASCRAVRQDSRGLRVLELTRSPAVLIEVGFLSNASEAARLNDGACQKKIASSIAEGIVEYLHN